MKDQVKLIGLILTLMMPLNIYKVSAQDFYKDYIRYLDARDIHRTQLSKTKVHAIHIQFADEFERVFLKVKQKTGSYMLKCDTLYIYSHDDYSSPGYSKLIWNRIHCCYYKNPSFSPIYKYKKKPIEIEADAKKRLRCLGPVLKTIIENVDTTGYQTYVKSSEVSLGAGIQFIVATKSQNHWHFFSSKVFASLPPD